MKIGSVDIPGKTVLAPMAGITDLPFRLICKELGAALVYTEMITAEGLVRRQRATLAMAETVPAERPVAFQLSGKKPETMAKAAGIAASLGTDIVDINMGCPARKVVSGGSGAALLKDLDAARRIIRAVVDASPVPVTVKLRTGWGAEDFVAPELAKAAEDAGASGVAVHGRYARQGFSGSADWGVIRAVKDAVRIPVIGNGDITDAGDALRMINETDCDLVMIGRGALGNPWLFREINALMSTGSVPEPPTSLERGDMLIRHFRAVVARLGEETGVKVMRKHAAWYSKGLTGAAEFRREINQTPSAVGFEDAVRGFFEGALRKAQHGDAGIGVGGL